MIISRKNRGVISRRIISSKNRGVSSSRRIISRKSRGLAAVESLAGVRSMGGHCWDNMFSIFTRKVRGGNGSTLLC